MQDSSRIRISSPWRYETSLSTTGKQSATHASTCPTLGGKCWANSHPEDLETKESQFHSGSRPPPHSTNTRLSTYIEVHPVFSMYSFIRHKVIRLSAPIRPPINIPHSPSGQHVIRSSSYRTKSPATARPPSPDHSWPNQRCQAYTGPHIQPEVTSAESSLLPTIEPEGGCPMPNQHSYKATAGPYLPPNQA